MNKKMRGLPLELPRSAPASSDLCEDDLSLQRTTRNLKKFMLWITAAAETSKDDIFRACTVKFALTFISKQVRSKLFGIIARDDDDVVSGRARRLFYFENYLGSADGV